MSPTAYVVDPDPEERKWIEATLSPSVEAVRSLDDAEALLAVLGVREGCGSGKRAWIGIFAALRCMVGGPSTHKNN
jgi:hypothetical protein